MRRKKAKNRQYFSEKKTFSRSQNNLRRKSFDEMGIGEKKGNGV